MNKVILMGRLTRNPEVKYTQGAESIAVTKYSLAVNRSYKRDGEPDVDFVNCVAFGKSGEFAEKYFHKGQLVAVEGRLQVRNWKDKEDKNRVSTDVIIEKQHFAESKKSAEPSEKRKYVSTGINSDKSTDFEAVSDLVDDDLPF